jgi:predicted TIM-barrel enzyme
MWIAANSYGVGTTDAWMFNYAVGIGSTLVPNNVRLAVGNVQITDKQINADTLEVLRLTSGIATITGADISNLHSNNIYSQTGVVTDISGTRLNYTGVGTITTFNSTNASITSLDLQRLTVAGISTFTNGPVLIGSGSQTGTLNQKLQVTGGAYISTYVGIGYTNPFSNLAIYDDNGAWISLVDPGQSSSAIENNNGTLYIRAEQGAGNSRIIFQTGTSNYEERPSVSGSDRVEIDNLGNLLINMGTPTGVSNQRLQVTGGAYVSGNTGIGLSTPTSRLQVQGDVLVSGVVTATTFYGNFYGTGISTISILDTQNLNVSGIITGGSYYVDGTQVISNARELQNIVSLDTVTTATIEAAIANAPNDFQSLNVAGVSTFVNGPVFIGSGTTTGTTSQRLQVTGGGYVSDNFGVGVTNPTSKLQVQGDASVSGVVTATTFNGQINSGLATITTLNATNSTLTNLNSTNGYIVSGIVTDLTNTRLTSGIATITTLNSTQSNLTNINSTGISTLNILQANTLQVSGIATFQDNVYLGINDVLNIGGVNYLKLFHDGGAGYIDNDTGILYYNSGQHFFQNAAGTEVLASFTGDGGASLYFDNVKKLETIGTGVTVTGTLYAQNLSTGDSGIGINISNNTITGPSIIIVDPAAVGDDTGAVRIKGDLYVDGAEFFVNSTTIELADLRVGIATTVGSNLLLDGGGIGIGSTNILKTFTYNYSSDSLKSSENLDITLSKTYKINGVDVISSTTLGSGVVNSSLTSVGTLTQLNVAGVGTIPTLNSTNANITNINATGISTIADIRAQRVTVTGIVTANTFRPTSGYIQAADGTNSFYIYDTTGNVAFQGTIGVGQINNAGGYQVITFNNIDTRLTGNLDVVGVTTSSVFNGNIYSLGVSTFRNGPVLVGSGTSTGTLNQPLQVTGGGYISTNLGIGSTNPQYLLDVNGDINFNGLLYQNNQQFIASRWSAGTGNDIYRLSQVGIGTTNPEYDLDVLGDVRIRGGLYDNLNNSAGLLDYVVVADGAGGWSWQPVTAAGAGTLDGIEVRDQGNVVGTSGSITTLDFRSVETSNIVVSGYAGGSIATITLSDEPIFATLGVLKSSGLGIATANTLQVTGITTLGIATVTDLTAQTINSSGIVTSGSLYISGNQVISSARQLQNIASLDSVTTATIEAAIANAPNDFTTLNVAGVSTFTNGPVLIGSGTSTGTTTQTLQVTGGSYISGSLGIGTTNPQYKLDVAGDLNFNGNLYQNGTKFTSGIGIGSTSVNPVSGVITPGARIGIGFTDINFVGTGLSVTGYGSTVVIDLGNLGGTTVSISTVSPGISTAAGNLWWDSTVGDLKIYYNDGNSAQWVDANGGSSVVTISESAPPGALNGDLWWDSTFGILKVYYDDGSSSQWVDANSGAYINYWIGTSAGIHTTGNVGVGTTIPTERLQVDGYLSIDGNTSYGTKTATTSSTSPVGIHSALAISTYRSVEYTIQATEGSNFHTTKILALHDGSTAYHTEYGTIFNNVGISTYDVDVSGGNIRLLATPASSSTTNFKITFNAIKV